MSLKLGKKPATTDYRDLQFARYSASTLPQVKVGFGHQALVEAPWGMLGNDQVGDCAIAGPAHEHMLTSAEGGHQVSFTDHAVLAAYSAITGYDPADPATDQGSDVRDVLKYRVKTGLVDAAGSTHRIAAYAALTPGDWPQLLQALNIGPVGIGIKFPRSAMDQFNAGKPWTVVAGSTIEGGHYVPVIARPHSAAVACITWGAIQLLTEGFYHRFCDEAFAILSPELLTDGMSLEGFNLAQLRADLSAL